MPEPDRLDKPSSSDPPDLAPLLHAQRVISALSPEHHTALLRILDAQPRIAESEMNRIEHLPKDERRRLGMLLARANCLPDWRVVTIKGLRPVSPEGLKGDQLRLYNYLLPTERQHHENNVIRHLWAHDAFKVKDIGLDAGLRARLRQLQRRTNDALALYDPAIQIKRPRKGRMLFIHIDERNFVEQFFGE